MPISKERAIAELKRRGVAIPPDVDLSNDLTKKPAPKSDKHPAHETLSKLTKTLSGLMPHADLTLGALQTAGDVGASLGNLLLEGKKIPKVNDKGDVSYEQIYKIPHPNLGKYKQSGLVHEANFLAGQILGPVGAEGKLYSKLTELHKLKGLGKYAGIAQHGGVMGYLGNEGQLGGRVGGAALGAAGGLVGTAVGDAIGLAKSTFGKATKDVLQEAANKKRTLNYKNKEKTSAENIVTKKEKAAQATNEKLEQLGDTVETLTGKLKKYAPNEAYKAKTALVEELKESKKAIKTNIKKQYDDYYVVHGKKPIAEPVTFDEFEKTHNLPKDAISDKTQDAIDLAIGKKNTVKVTPKTGSKYGVFTKNSISPGKADVKNYVELSKQLKKQAADYTAAFNNKHIEPGLAKQYGKYAQKFNDFAQVVDKHIEGALGNDYAKLKGINENFVNLELPFRQEGYLKSATTGRGKVPIKHFHGALNERGTHVLKKYLLDTNPNFAKIMAQHDLRHVNYGDPEALAKLLGSDQGRDLPKHVQTTLASLEDALNSKSGVKELVGKIQAHEMTRHSHSAHLNKVFKNHPDLERHFEDIHKEQERHRKIRNQLKKMNLSQKEIDSEMTIYDKALKKIAQTYITFKPGEKYAKHKPRYYKSGEK